MTFGHYIFLPALVAALAADEPATSQTPTAKAGSTSDLTKNPHWRPDGCVECHEARDGKIEKIAPNLIDLICLKCHDGAKAKAEPHPIGRSFANDQIHKPENWPTPGGLLSCITCHDVLEGCHQQFKSRTANPTMLRGPIRLAPSFCNQCHIAEKQQQRNPHAAMKGEDASMSCLFCHQQEMPSTAQHRAGEPKLKNEEITLCGQCHPQHPDFFTPGHNGITATPVILQNMQNHDEKLVGQDMAQKRGTLPLRDAKVVCSTCHNPHMAGVFNERSILDQGAMNPEASPDNFALRIQGAHLCIYCHGTITRNP